MMIRLERVSKTYRRGRIPVVALADVSLAVEAGQCVLLTGPSGSGKTTLLNVLGCLTRPSQGEIWLNGRDAARLPDHFRSHLRRHEIGFIFQQFNLLPGETVLDNIALPLVPTGMRPREHIARARALAERLGLGERVDFHGRELSGGEQQRVAIARALINDPALILADEPNSNVDRETATAILDLFAQLKRQGKTLLIASHDPLWRESELVDGLFHLKDGRLVSQERNGAMDGF